MKKLLSLLLLTALFISCRGPMGPSGPMGPEGPQGQGTDWKVVWVTVNKADWQLIGQPGALGSYYRCVVAAPEITDFVYEQGAVIGYMVMNYGQTDEVQTPLNIGLPRGETGTNGEALWTDFYSFDFTPGSIAFYYEPSDFATQIVPEIADFRIVVMW